MNKRYLMEDVLECIISHSGKLPKFTSKGIPTLSTKSVKNNYIDYSKCYYLSKNDYKKLAIKELPKKGDILLTIEAPLGRAARLDRDGIALAWRLIALRGKKGILSNDFLLYFLQSKKGQSLLNAKKSGTTITGIRLSDFKKIIIEIPTYNIQEKITYILKLIDEKISINNKINDNLLH